MDSKIIYAISIVATIIVIIFGYMSLTGFGNNPDDKPTNSMQLKKKKMIFS